MNILELSKDEETIIENYKAIISNINDIPIYQLMIVMENIFKIPKDLQSYMIFVKPENFSRSIIYIITREFFEDYDYHINVTDTAGYNLFNIKSYNKITFNEIDKKSDAYHMRESRILKECILKIFKSYVDDLRLGLFGIQKHGYAFHHTLKYLQKRSKYSIHSSRHDYFRYGITKKFYIKDMIIFKCNNIRHRKLLLDDGLN